GWPTPQLSASASGDPGALANRPMPWIAGSPGADDWVSLARKAIEPITSYPPTYLQMNREAREQVGHGLEQISQACRPGVHDPIGFIKGLGNVGLGSIGYVGSPVHAALRTVAGKPFENVFGIPKEYTEFALSLGLPALGGLRPVAGVPTPRS